MHVNHEAEAVAQKFYRLAFDTQPEFPLVTAMDNGTAACIWINPSLDLICPMSSMTDEQCDALNSKMYDMKVQRIGLNDCALERSSKIPCDKWGTFPKITPPAWMNENIKEITLYTSRMSLLPHGELNLTEFDYATANLTPSLKISKLVLMRQHNKFFQDLRRVQKLQIRQDAKNLSLGLAISRINDCPQWLLKIGGIK
ncbi:hypothetical protein EYC80_010194 [Monilinia laxa]|uniref:Uncharacterized protein n=1 Tax=Monilinia laxa TaxID=61186 RepID=A0A5N6JLT8_MONLA|nr:hypothetical protein EYC80_010194 [Monilinia laxa]